eukprot:365446-Chlamydomonas_euryale.AAC.4
MPHARARRSTCMHACMLHAESHTSKETGLRSPACRATHACMDACTHACTTRDACMVVSAAPAHDCGGAWLRLPACRATLRCAPVTSAARPAPRRVRAPGTDAHSRPTLQGHTASK